MGEEIILLNKVIICIEIFLMFLILVNFKLKSKTIYVIFYTGMLFCSVVLFVISLTLLIKVVALIVFLITLILFVLYLVLSKN